MAIGKRRGFEEKLRRRRKGLDLVDSDGSSICDGEGKEGKRKEWRKGERRCSAYQILEDFFFSSKDNNNNNNNNTTESSKKERCRTENITHHQRSERMDFEGRRKEVEWDREIVGFEGQGQTWDLFYVLFFCFFVISMWGAMFKEPRPPHQDTKFPPFEVPIPFKLEIFTTSCQQPTTKPNNTSITTTTRLSK